jgi:hypothetical protein
MEEEIFGITTNIPKNVLENRDINNSEEIQKVIYKCYMVAIYRARHPVETDKDNLFEVRNNTLKLG